MALWPVIHTGKRQDKILQFREHLQVESSSSSSTNFIATQVLNKTSGPLTINNRQANVLKRKLAMHQNGNTAIRTQLHAALCHWCPLTYTAPQCLHQGQTVLLQSQNTPPGLVCNSYNTSTPHYTDLIRAMPHGLTLSAINVGRYFVWGVPTLSMSMSIVDLYSA